MPVWAGYKWLNIKYGELLTYVAICFISVVVYN
jgi:hypothetical protein